MQVHLSEQVSVLSQSIFAYVWSFKSPGGGAGGMVSLMQNAVVPGVPGRSSAVMVKEYDKPRCEEIKRGYVQSREAVKNEI